MALHVTSHAISRYRERVAPVSYDDARTALSCAAVELAASIGAPFVKLGTGQHVVVRDQAVITVLPKDKHLGTLARDRWAELQRGEYQA